MHIEDRVFIVTGASSGVGLATAEALAARGGRVALLARSKDKLDELAARLPGSLPLFADLADFKTLRAAIGATFMHYRRIDGLVNNAGRSHAATVEAIDPDDFDEIFRLNVLGPTVAMQAVIPVFRAAKRGSIVNVNSGAAFMAIPGCSVYSASKRALMGISLTARQELEKDGIVVSEVYPVVAATNFGKNRIGSGGPPGNSADGDKPEFVAELIVQAIEEGKAQYFANESLRRMAGA